MYSLYYFERIYLSFWIKNVFLDFVRWRYHCIYCLDFVCSQCSWSCLFWVFCSRGKRLFHSMIWMESVIFCQDSHFERYLQWHILPLWLLNSKNRKHFIETFVTNLCNCWVDVFYFFFIIYFFRIRIQCCIPWVYFSKFSPKFGQFVFFEFRQT